MVDRHTMALAFEDALQMLQRPEVLSEYEGLFVRRAEELDQSRGLHVLLDRAGAPFQRFELVALPRSEERALGQPPQRLRGGEGAAPDLPLEDDEGEPRGPRHPPGGGPIGIADEIGHVVVEASLGGAQSDGEAVHAAGRQGERNPPSVADHDVAQAIPQLGHVRGDPAIPAPDISVHEAFVGPEGSRFQKADEVEQLLHVVLDRSRGQQEHVFFREACDEPPVHAEAVLQPMGLVHDDEIPRSRLGGRPMRTALGQVDGRDQVGSVLPVAEGSQNREWQVEFGFHLLAPLSRQ